MWRELAPAVGTITITTIMAIMTMAIIIPIPTPITRWGRAAWTTKAARPIRRCTANQGSPTDDANAH